MEKILALLKGDHDFGQLCDQLRTGEKELYLSAPSFFRAFLVAGLFHRLQRTMLIVTKAPANATAWFQELGAFLPGQTALFEPWVNFPFEMLSPTAEAAARKLEVLHRLRHKPVVVVTDAQTLLRQIAPLASAVERPVALRKGMEQDPHDLAEVMVKKGYVRADIVEEKGQFTLRGGILDVFPAQLESPIRLEFFGDEIESLRLFDVPTQTSSAAISEALVFGSREIDLESATVTSAIERMRATPGAQLTEEISALRRGRYFQGIERFLPFLYEKPGNLVDYVPAESILLWDELADLRADAERFLNKQQEYLEESLQLGQIPSPPRRYFLTLDEIKARLDLPQVFLSALEIPAQENGYRFQADPVEPFLGNERVLVEWLRKHSDALKIVIALAEQALRERVLSRLKESGLLPQTSEAPDVGINVLASATKELSDGFVYPSIGLALIGKGTLLHPERQPQRAAPTTPQIKLDELAPGNLVVHSDYGVARYLGLVKEELDSGAWECLVLRYKNGVLKVRTDHLSKVSRYVGSDGDETQISRLGGREWQRVKSRAQKAVRKLALDLLDLYAKRAQSPGHRFTNDTPWQRELEEGFPYQETADQIRAISEVKKDMESDRPMDRLVCGDVGYGKTEVALRAAFKAVVDGKQVMLLVPTTILAQQHWANFQARLAPFPIKVEMLSRFRSPREQRQITSELAEGKIDIVIGTHRLLQSDIAYKDLGLVVIDEEQRFGVEAKEKLRDLRKSVDVLTMTATPIPRTLQMALTGVRDLSIIETPPANRQPIVTYVNQFDAELVKKAIGWELGRGGQIYYVHNRVEDIERVARFLRELVPEARLAIAHGQMSETLLEDIMLDFLAKKYDLLLSTTIIESGIDIPSVNTLIADQAERMGLAQLYQLRGRVGRSERRAHAYFLYSEPQRLKDSAADRLRTISEFTALGSGFKIALKDLEIRGAGNLLGAEQHGHLAAVGFHLYVEMLRQAIQELEGKPIGKVATVNIRLPVKAYIPTDYVEQESLRIELYRRLAQLQKVEEVESVKRELRDRFGALPLAAENLLEINVIRIKSQQLGVTSIQWQMGKLSVFPLEHPVFDLLSSQAHGPGLSYKKSRKTLSVSGLEAPETVAVLNRVLSDVINDQKAVGPKATS